MQQLIVVLLGAAVASSVPTSSVVPHCTQSSFPVANGDFETGSLAPWHIGTDGRPGPRNVTIVASSRGSSKYVVQLTANGTTGDELRQSHIPTCQGYNFTIYFDYRFTKTAPNCVLGVAASHSSHVEFVSLPSNQSQWTNQAFVYSDFIYKEIELSAELDCPSGSSAVAQLDNFKLAQGASLEPAGCPKTVQLLNGGFESGELAPWTQPSNELYNIANYSVFSPGRGARSKYLYEVKFPTTNYSVFGLSHQVHDLCINFNYTVSFDVSWGNYTSPSPRPNGCQLLNGLKHTSFRNYSINAPVYIHPPSKPIGWQSFNFTAQAGRNGPSTLYLEIVCDAQFGHKGPYPPIGVFSFQLDNVELRLTEEQ